MNLEKRYMDLNRGSSKLSKGLDIANTSSSTASNATKLTRNSMKLAGRSASNMGLATSGLDLVGKTSSTAKKISDISFNAKNANKIKNKLDGMSDDDLRKTVNRMDLEKQYSSLKSETVSRGKVTAGQILSVAGDVLAVGASASAIALMMVKMKR